MKKISLLFWFFLFLIPNLVFSASLFSEISRTSVVVGETVTISFFVSSKDGAMNAVSGSVSYPKDLLEIVSVSKNNSIASLWVAEPSFDNSKGLISFEAVVLNPGFVGEAGKIVSFIARGKAGGSGRIDYLTGSVLANDGLGTEINKSSFGVGFEIREASVSPPKIVVSQDFGPEIIISSKSHPDQARWYKDKNPNFFWELPAGTLEIKTVLSERPKSEPIVRYVPPISSKEVKDLNDGVYYFFVQGRSGDGLGNLARYQVNIDTTPPSSFSTKISDSSFGQSRPEVFFSASDTGSGLDYYEIKVDGSQPIKVTAENKSFVLPEQDSGEHRVLITVFDKAGNHLAEEKVFSIVGLSPPTIVSYPKEISVGGEIKIIGHTYPQAEVEVFLKKDNLLINKDSVKSDELGNFSITISKRLSSGEYVFSAKVRNEAGLQSKETNSYQIKVSFGFLKDAFLLIANYFLIFLFILLAVFIILIVGIWGWYKLVILNKELQGRAEEMNYLVKGSFARFHTELDERIHALHRIKGSRALTLEESEFLEKFDKNMMATENAILEEVKEISPKKKRVRRPKAPPLEV